MAKAINWAVVVVYWSSSSPSAPKIRVRFPCWLLNLYENENILKRGWGWPIFRKNYRLKPVLTKFVEAKLSSFFVELAVYVFVLSIVFL